MSATLPSREAQDQRYGSRPSYPDRDPHESHDGLRFVLASICMALVLAGLFFTSPAVLAFGGTGAVACYFHACYRH